MAFQSKSEFEALFKTHYAALVRYALRMLNDRDQAEDTVQQIFVNLWEKREHLEITDNALGYLLRTVHNACLNVIKHLQVKNLHVEHEMHSRSEISIENTLEAEEFRQKVKTAVQQLPPQCKKIFLMSRIQGKKYGQIADELNLSIKTVENQMGKALRLLRNALHEERTDLLRVVKSIFWLAIGVQFSSIVIQ